MSIIYLGMKDLTVRIYRRMWHVWVMYSEACRVGGTPTASNPVTDVSAGDAMPPAGQHAPSSCEASARPRLHEADIGLSEMAAFFKQHC